MDVNDNPVIEESEIVDVVDKEEIIGTNTTHDIPAAMIEEIAKYNKGVNDTYNQEKKTIRE